MNMNYAGKILFLEFADSNILTFSSLFNFGHFYSNKASFNCSLNHKPQWMVLHIIGND